MCLFTCNVPFPKVSISNMRQLHLAHSLAFVHSCCVVWVAFMYELHLYPRDKMYLILKPPPIGDNNTWSLPWLLSMYWSSCMWVQSMSKKVKHNSFTDHLWQGSNSTWPKLLNPCQVQIQARFVTKVWNVSPSHSSTPRSSHLSFLQYVPLLSINLASCMILSTW